MDNFDLKKYLVENKLTKNSVHIKLQEEYSPLGKLIPNNDLWDYVYHLSNPKYRESIQTQGLTPTGGEWASAYGNNKTKAIFAANSPDPENWFDYGYDYDVWAIKTNAIPNKWYEDVNGPQIGANYFIVTPDPIPPSALSLIHKGDGTSVLNTGLRKLAFGSTTNQKALSTKRKNMKLPS